MTEKLSPKALVTAHFADAKLVVTKNLLIDDTYRVELMNGTVLGEAKNAAGAWSRALKTAEADPARFGVMEHNKPKEVHAVTLEREGNTTTFVPVDGPLTLNAGDKLTVHTTDDPNKVELNIQRDDGFARRLEQVRADKGVMMEPKEARKPLLAGKPSERAARSMGLLDYGRVLTPADLGTSKAEPEPQTYNNVRNVPPKVKAHRRHKNKLAAKSRQMNRRKAR
jgi:hypothetical protein